jgi:spermidine dehydrogenase
MGQFMNNSDKHLGMNRRITRRDLLHGAGSIAAASFIPGQAFADAMLALEEQGAAAYPPALTGLRGSHVGSFEVAHQLALEGRRDWGVVEEPDESIYDLVVVGGGISGLSAAHFYRKNNPDARILILDNHDDFGGHAKRNEFTIGDRTILGYGGSQSMEEPSGYSEIVNSLLRDIGVDKSRFDKAYDGNFYKRNGLSSATYFDSAKWGTDVLVRYSPGSVLDYLPLADSRLSAAEAVNQMPLSNDARRELLHVLTESSDRLPGLSQAEKIDHLYSISYREFLDQYLGVTEPEVFALFQSLTSDTTVGIESSTAGDSISYVGLPGAQATGVVDRDGLDEPYIHHFPDGNASIARLLVRQMIPAVAPGNSMEDIVTARFDYRKLDVENAPVRLRLRSTVVNVEHDDDIKSAKTVAVSYVRNWQNCRVRGKRVVMACYNGIIPSICPELPAAQREALAKQVKSPILYSTVALNNWRAWKKLGVGAVVAPTSYHINAMLDFPVNIGEYKYASEPDDPIVVHMERFPHRANQGISVREQRRLGQQELYATTFESIERHIRQQLTGMLSGGDFDPARDIAGITVNRWAHGYADGYNNLEDPYYGDKDNERYPHVIGRKPFGRVAIANSDSGAQAMLQSAIEQAHRAITDLA